MVRPDGCLPFAVSGRKKERIRPSLNEADLAAAGLGAEAGAGGFEYVIEELLRHRKKAGVYEFLVAWAGYEEQTWEKAENLPKVVVDDYLARKEGSEDNEDDPEDPEDPPPPPVVVS